MKLFDPRDVHLAARVSGASYKEGDEEIQDALGRIGNRSMYLDPVPIEDAGWFDTGIWKERKCILTVHQRLGDGRLTLLIAFRGTCDKWDALADLEYDQTDFEMGNINGKVHTGVLARYEEYRNNVIAEVERKLKELDAHGTPVKDIIITGHSLGGAVATICYSDLYQKYSHQFKVFCITFGAPRVGNKELRDSIQPQREYIGRFIIENCKKDYTKNDPVPHLPVNRTDSRNDESWLSSVLHTGQRVASDVWATIGTTSNFGAAAAVVNAEINRDEYRSIVDPTKITCYIENATSRVDYHDMKNYLKAVRNWYNHLPIENVQLSICSGSIVDAFRMQWNLEGFPSSKVDHQAGGTGGSSHTLRLENDEFVDHIEIETCKFGTVDDCIGRLVITVGKKGSLAVKTHVYGEKGKSGAFNNSDNSKRLRFPSRETPISGNNWLRELEFTTRHSGWANGQAFLGLPKSRNTWLEELPPQNPTTRDFF